MIEFRKQIKELVTYILNPEERDEDVIENYTDTVMLACEEYHIKQLKLYGVVGQSEQLNYGFKKLDIVEWKGVNLKIVYIHEDTQQASIETLPDNNNYNIYKVSLKQLTKVI